MRPGTYFVLMFIFMLTLLGLASFAIIVTDIALLFFTDREPVFGGWSLFAVALGLGSLLATAADIIRSN
jgi:hypothetical protein